MSEMLALVLERRRLFFTHLRIVNSMAISHDRLGKVGDLEASWAALAFELRGDGRGVTSARWRGHEKGGVSMTRSGTEMD